MELEHNELSVLKILLDEIESGVSDKTDIVSYLNIVMPNDFMKRLLEIRDRINKEHLGL